MKTIDQKKGITSHLNDLRSGALTENYPLNREIACEKLNEALATEIICVLRYRHHQVIAKGIHCIPVSEEFAEHAAQEEKHMMMLAERINQLGGDPDFNPARVSAVSLTGYGNAKTLIDMIKDNLTAERTVITVYRDLIQWFEKDSTTRILLESILTDEEEHASDLADLLAD